MRILEARFSTWRDEPTAIQCRIGGAKGLLCMYHDLSADEEEEPEPDFPEVKLDELLEDFDEMTLDAGESEVHEAA